MCGIFGIVVADAGTVPVKEAEAILATLFRLSESRGKESAGIAAMAFGAGQAWIAKSPLPPTDFLKRAEPRRVVDAAVSAAVSAGLGYATIAHSRMVTNGTQYSNENNQPVSAGETVLVHNGIVTNVADLWRRAPRLVRRSEVDSEFLAARLDVALRSDGQSIPQATRAVFSDIEGAASVAALLPGGSAVMLATNTGSLYTASSSAGHVFVFASEEFILNKVISEHGLHARWQVKPALRVEPNTACVLTSAAGRINAEAFALDGAVAAGEASPPPPAALIVDCSAPAVSSRSVLPAAAPRPLPYDEARLRALHRCSRCILPSTFPFIEFDAQGVCNYCRSHQPLSATLGAKAFEEAISHYRRADGRPDCIVAFSGGRDSSYGLHLLKREFGLNPITFTYDWGMVTDLARRNIARVCGKLGIENILVSADIAAKRNNIRKNLQAWIAAPHLGLIPLLMAGDKQFFKYMNVVRRQTGLRLNIWCTNNLENTHFKVGLCGIRPNFQKERIDALSLSQKARLALFYGTKFLANPKFLNGSMADTLEAFWSYYFEERSDNFLLFNYVPWEEEEVNRTLIGEYSWETSPDSESTWRIGDGTAAFYNYCYVSVLGFSEFDTFLSNQVREGMVARDEAMRRVFRDNRPRAESLYWYLSTVGLDPEATIPALNVKLERMRALIAD
jgi:glucosamine--fructose-6-phosphate aminotransferase (isomerizing)